LLTDLGLQVVIGFYAAEFGTGFQLNGFGKRFGIIELAGIYSLWLKGVWLRKHLWRMLYGAAIG
jgi:hypothetical protein